VVVDRQTGTSPVGDKVVPVRYAAFGYAAWLNRTDQAGELGADYRPTRPPQDQHYPEGAAGGDAVGAAPHTVDTERPSGRVVTGGAPLLATSALGVS